jgi:hypothetical protein
MRRSPRLTTLIYNVKVYAVRSSLAERPQKNAADFSDAQIGGDGFYCSRRNSSGESPNILLNTREKWNGSWNPS